MPELRDLDEDVTTLAEPAGSPTAAKGEATDLRPGGNALRELRRIRQLMEARSAELLDAIDSAVLLSLSRSTFFRLVAAGKLPKPMKFGKQVSRWSRRALLDAVGVRT